MLLRWWPRLMAVLSELLVLMNGDGTGGGALWNLGDKQWNIWFRIPPIFCSFAASSGCGARGWWSRNVDILDPLSSRSAAAGQYSLLELQTIHRFSQSRRRPTSRRFQLGEGPPPQNAGHNFFSELSGAGCLDMGTSWYFSWKLNYFGIPKWK